MTLTKGDLWSRKPFMEKNFVSGSCAYECKSHGAIQNLYDDWEFLNWCPSHLFYEDKPLGSVEPQTKSCHLKCFSSVFFCVLLSWSITLSSLIIFIRLVFIFDDVTGEVLEIRSNHQLSGYEIIRFCGYLLHYSMPSILRYYNYVML